MKTVPMKTVPIKTSFLNVDLEIESYQDLKLIVKAFGDEALNLYCFIRCVSLSWLNALRLDLIEFACPRGSKSRKIGAICQREH